LQDTAEAMMRKEILSCPWVCAGVSPMSETIMAAHSPHASAKYVVVWDAMDGTSNLHAGVNTGETHPSSLQHQAHPSPTSSHVSPTLPSPPSSHLRAPPRVSSFHHTLILFRLPNLLVGSRLYRQMVKFHPHHRTLLLHTYPFRQER
jgi:hypothetical protein